MSQRIAESIEVQKKQILELTDAIAQLRGSIAALEYVQTLGLKEPEEEVPVVDGTVVP